jgi:arsenical pump membrane protein
VVACLLLGFVVGPSFGIDPWVVALLADVVLIVVTRTVPLRQVPILTALGVAAVAAVVSLVLPADLLTGVLTSTGPAALGATVVGAAAGANAVNNLPALLVALDGVDRMTGGMWAWLAGVNVGAALLPIGALANLLWWRIVRAEGVAVDVRSYLRITLPIAGPALLAAAAAVALGSLLPT